jgi:hypothetical protein
MAADRKKELFVEATQQIKAGKYGQASKVLKELMALEPANIEYRRLSASLNLKLGNIISAKAVYDSLVQEAMQMRDFRLAESLLREYLAAGPRYVPFLERLGQVCEDNNNPMVAANEYGKALQILLEDADPEESGHAEALYAKIKDLSPNNPVLAQYDPTKFSRAPRTASPSPLAAAIKMSEPPGVPAPPEPPGAPPVAAPPPPVAPPPVAAAPAATKPPRLLDDAPMVEDDLTDVLAPKERPKPRPIPQPAAPPPPPMVEDDLTELLSKPIPKRAPLPEKPSFAQKLFGFLKSSPAPEAPAAEAPPAEAPPAPPPPPAAEPPPAAPVPAAPPQWKPWQPEEPAATATEPPPAEPAATPQGTEWKAWQPTEPEAAAPVAASAPPAEKPLGTGAGFLVVDSRKGAQESAPSLGAGIGESAPIPRKARPAAPQPARAVPVRRAGGLAKAVKTVVTLVVVVSVLAGGAYGALVVGFFLLEKGSSDTFRNFAGAPPSFGQNPRKNAHLLLLGFDADAGRDPMAEGYERLQKPASAQPVQCAWEQPSSSLMRFPDDTSIIETWWQGPDPIGQFQKEAARIQGWTAGSPVLLERYRQWLGMPFEDGGYGTFAVPNCALVLTAHRLHVAEGFGQGPAKGAIERLEQDLKAWRAVLAQARTLPVKQLAFAIFNDDLMLLAGVFGRPDVTGDIVSDLVPLTKPLEQVERSLRWSMQNALAVDTKLFATNALFDAVKNPSPLMRMLKVLPLPKQRALNAYAEHFEALLKAADQPLTTPPPLYEFARTPARSIMDDVTNPVDNLLPSRTVVAWDQQVGVVFDTEARLRLVGVAALLRGASRKAIPGRIAEAGSKYTDPFTELPMLLNPARGVIYSVGRNHRDDDGDPRLDVTIAWPFTEPPREAPKGRR